MRGSTSASTLRPLIVIVTWLFAIVSLPTGSASGCARLGALHGPAQHDPRHLSPVFGGSASVRGRRDLVFDSGHGLVERGFAEIAADQGFGRIRGEERRFGKIGEADLGRLAGSALHGQ